VFCCEFFIYVWLFYVGEKPCTVDFVSFFGSDKGNVCNL
jgi:hypothetical protein